MAHPVLEEIAQEIGRNKILTGDALKERYSHVWKMDEPLDALAVMLPESTADVSAILKICHQSGQPIVPHGGLTNLVGSTETNSTEIALSLERMNAIEEVDAKSRTMTVQAGVILENAQEAAADQEMLFPLNYGAKGSAQVGGAISTNAGGLKVLKFGMTRNLVVGLEAVLADGTIVSSLKKIIKDNSAYDLKQLFIGSEGTLGIVTRAVLKLVEAPRSRVSALMGVSDYDHVVELLKFMDRNLAGTLSGFEIIWPEAYETLTSPSHVKAPLPYTYNLYVMMEALGSDQEKDRLRLESLLEQALEEGLVEDAVPAYTGSDQEWFWGIRENVDPLVAACENVQQFDISLPVGLIGEVVGKIKANLEAAPEVEKVFTFGHVADGNIHFITGKKDGSQEMINKVNDIIYAPLKAIGGSVSAEHGIGLDKKAYLNISRNEEELEVMKTLKRTLDPKGILNPGKVLDL